MLTDYTVKAKIGYYLVIYRHSTGEYEVWLEHAHNIKQHTYIGKATNLTNATAIAQQQQNNDFNSMMNA